VAPVVASVTVPGDATSQAAGAASVSSALKASDAPAVDDVTMGGVSLLVGWAGDLPKPTLDGAEATYANVAAGMDLRVRALPRGVETFVDIAQPATVPADGVTVSLPLSAKGLTVAQDGQGGIQVKDSAGRIVSDTPPARIRFAIRHSLTRRGRRLWRRNLLLGAAVSGAQYFGHWYVNQGNRD
jgi:hypothetical protein